MYPTRSRTHDEEDESKSLFNVQRPRTWKVHDPEWDYGWDMSVIIPHERPDEVGRELRVQLKASEAEPYVKARAFITRPMKVTTIHWLLEMQTVPVLVAVADLTRADRPIFWGWLHELVAGFGKGWEGKKKITVRVPTDRVLKTSAQRIERETNEWHAERDAKRELGTIAIDALPDLLPDGPNRMGQLEAAPARFREVLRASAIADTDPSSPSGLRPVGPADREARAELERIKHLLDALDAREARRLLDRIGLSRCNNRTRAIYENRLGALLMQEADPLRAVARFRTATRLAPKETAFACNVLVAEAYLDACGRVPLPADWFGRLEALLRDHSDFLPAIAVKARVLARTDPEAAEAVVRESPLWERRRSEALLLLAEIYSCADRVKARALFAGVPEADVRDDHVALGLRGFICLGLSVGSTAGEAVDVHFPGPSNIDLHLLSESVTAYRLACDRLGRAGYPPVGAETFRNAAHTLLLANRPREAAELCRTYTSHNPTDSHVRDALIIALSLSGERDKASECARRRQESDPSDGTLLNYVVTLHGAGDLETVREVVEKRLGEGPLLPEYETRIRELYAIALGALGDDKKASAEAAALARVAPAAAVAVSAAIERRKPEGARRAVGLLRDGLRRFPGSPELGSMLMQALLPVTQDNAQEIIALVAEQVAPRRALLPEEALTFGRAYVSRGEWANAEKVFRSARERFPENSEFAFDHATALAELGRVDDAYALLSEFAKLRRPTSHVLHNLGMLALMTGRLDQAIELAEQAADRERDGSARRTLRMLCFELRRKRGDQPKEMVAAAVRLASATTGDIDAEAAYLMRAMLIPLGEADRRDPEVMAWGAELQARYERFAAEHPTHPAFRRFRVPAGLDGQALLNFIGSEYLAVMWPAVLHRQNVELAARGRPLPLAVKARVLGGCTALSYWQQCLTSPRESDVIACHIDGLNDLAGEVQVASQGGPVCLDLSAILSLRHLGLLDAALAQFGEAFICPETLRVIQAESVGMPTPNLLAREIEEWLLENRGRMRTRRPRQAAASGSESPVLDLVDGFGQTCRLALELAVPLYSDDAAIRFLATTGTHLRAFGTVAFLRSLRLGYRLSSVAVARHLISLVNSHYRHVPIASEDLLALATSPDAVGSDEELTSLIAALSAQDLTDPSVLGVGVATLVQLIANEGVPAPRRDAVATQLTFVLLQRNLGTVLRGVRAGDSESRLLSLWGHVFVGLYGSGHRGRLDAAWSTFDSVAQSNCPDEPRYKRIIGEAPAAVLAAVRADSDLKGRTEEAVFAIGRALPYSVQEDFEKGMVKALQRS